MIRCLLNEFSSCHGGLILPEHPISDFGLLNILDLLDFQRVLAVDLSFISQRGIRQIWPPLLPASSSRHFCLSPPSLNGRYFAPHLLSLQCGGFKKHGESFAFSSPLPLVSTKPSASCQRWVCSVLPGERHGRVHPSSAAAVCLFSIIEWCFVGLFIQCGKWLLCACACYRRTEISKMWNKASLHLVNCR